MLLKYWLRQKLHGQGIMYRDLKPENILTADGHVRLFDLGSQRGSMVLMAAVTKVGTPTIWHLRSLTCTQTRVTQRLSIYGHGVAYSRNGTRTALVLL